MPKTKTIFFAFTLVDSPIAKYFLKLSEEMIKRDYQVVIITSNQKRKLVSTRTNPAIYTWPSFRPTKLKDAFFLIELIQTYNPSLILSNFVADNICLLTANIMNVPIRAFHQHLSYIKYRGHGVDIKAKYKIWRKKQLYRCATDCFPVSNAIADEAKTIFKIKEAKIKVFYNALEDPLLADKQIPKTDFDLICAGQLINRKGQDILIKSIRIVKPKKPHIKLSLLGNGPERLSYQRLIDQLDLTDHVFLAGNVSHSKVIELIAYSKVVIVPSRAEAFGYVVIEAMSVGTPVIASNVGGIPEIIRDGVDGFLVPPDDPDALAEKIMIILGDHNLRKQMGANARQRFLEKFELSQAAKRQADWLDKKITITQQ